MPRRRISNLQNLALDNRNLASVNWADISAGTSRTGSMPDPYGGNQASLVSENVTTSAHAVYNAGSLITLPGNSWFCLSSFFKPGTGNFAGFIVDGGANFQITSYFNLTTGDRTYLNNGGGPLCTNLDTSVSSPVGNSQWRRYSMRGFNAAPTFAVFMQLAFSNDGTTVGYTGDPARNYSVFSPGMAFANQPGDVTDTSSALVNPTGRIRNVALGRKFAQTLGHRDPQNTKQNLVRLSEDFTPDDVTWFGFSMSVTTNQAIAPNGTLTADLLSEDAVDDYHVVVYVVDYITTLPFFLGRDHTFSCYMKYAGCRYAGLYLTVQGQDGGVVVDLLTGQITLLMQDVPGGVTNARGNVSAAGNGWYRVSYTITPTQQWDGSGGSAFGFVTSSDGTTLSYLGDISHGFYAWGYQMTRANWAGQYVVTTGTPAFSAIRNAAR